MTTISSLYTSKAGKAWHYFAQISQIPRPSHHEGQIRDFLERTAEAKGWAVKGDKIGNIVISIPGQGELADCEPLVIQGHMDMVCEKNSDTTHDFHNDPLKLRIDGDWLKATGTTLGADNGVAMAYGLAVAELECPHKLPLELLFTVNEEDGMGGALNLEADLFKGRTVLNVDSEDDELFIIGCAGGATVKADFPITKTSENAEPHYQIVLKGFAGGHSGIGIGEHENAIIHTAKMLKELDGPSLKLHTFTGGNKRNAIPRECTVTVSGCTEATIKAATHKILEQVIELEPQAHFEISEIAQVAQEVPCDIFRLINDLPNGILTMHGDFEGIVETSCSLNVVNEAEGEVKMILSIRSSCEIAKLELAAQAETLVAVHNGFPTASDDYPGWAPQKNSQLLNRAKLEYQNLFGVPPSITSIHAGLECGVIGSIIQSPELLSIGPKIKDPHSPDERLSIQSFEKIYSFITQLVQTDLTK